MQLQFGLQHLFCLQDQQVTAYAWYLPHPTQSYISHFPLCAKCKISQINLNIWNWFLTNIRREYNFSQNVFSMYTNNEPSKIVLFVLTLHFCLWNSKVSEKDEGSFFPSSLSLCCFFRISSNLLLGLRSFVEQKVRSCFFKSLNATHLTLLLD